MTSTSLEGARLKIAAWQNGPGERPQGDYHDPKDQLYALYLSDADKEDRKLTDSLKGDADGILIFTGLFAATVASWNIELYKTLTPNTGDATVALLTQIARQMASLSNSTQSSSPSLPDVIQSLDSFEPSSASILINSLWFLSLFLSLLCALFATLVQQWSRRYLHNTQKRGRPHVRGRLQVYLCTGMEGFRIQHVVGWIVTLLHVALILFLAGLVVFLFEINKIVAYVILTLAILALVAYTILSILPIFYSHCPYSTPFTEVFRVLTVGPSIILLRAIIAIRRSIVQPRLSIIDRFLVDAMWTNYLSQAQQLWETSWDMSKYAYNSDERMLRKTFGLLDEEHEIQLFFSNVHALSRAYDIPIARYFHKGLLSWNDFIKTLYELLLSYRDACSQASTKSLALERSSDCLRFLWRLLTCADERHSLQSLVPFLPSCDFFAGTEDPVASLYAKCSRAFIYNFCLKRFKAAASIADERTASAMKQIMLVLQADSSRACLDQDTGGVGEKFELDHEWLYDNGQIANIVYLSRSLVSILPHLPPEHVDKAFTTIRLLIISISAITPSAEMKATFSDFWDELKEEVDAGKEDESSPPATVRLVKQLAPLAASLDLR